MENAPFAKTSSCEVEKNHPEVTHRLA